MKYSPLQSVFASHPLNGRVFSLPRAEMLELRAQLGARPISDWEQLAARMRSRGDIPSGRSAGRMLPFSITGLACHYGKLIQNARGPEPHRLQPGCFRTSLVDVPLLSEHRGPTIIGALKFVDTPTGLLFSARIPDTQAGRELVACIKASPSETVCVSVLASPERTISRELNGIGFNDVLSADLKHLAIVEKGADSGATAWLVPARNN